MVISNGAAARRALACPGSSILFFAALVFFGPAALAQSYMPSGVQQNVPVSTVTNGGWTECYRDTYANSGTPVATILNQCNEARLMLACRPTGSNTLQVLAQAPRADVTFDTGTGNATRSANGVEWYFNDSYSWGFAPGGQPVSRNSCDTTNTGNNDRLCWHTSSTAINTGWRCGSNTGLNFDPTFERIVYVPGGVLEADLSVTKTGPMTAVAGTTVTYDITVTNNGPSDAADVVVDDPTPMGYTFVSANGPCAGGFPCAFGLLPATGSASVQVTYAIDPAFTGPVTNTATVTTSTADPTPANDTSSVTTSVVAEADVAITKAGPMTAIAGTTVTYDFTVANNGPSDATSVSVNDTPPPGLALVSATGPCAGGFPCALGTLPAGAPPIAFQATFAIDPAVVGNVTNVAEVTSATTDPNAGNNIANATTGVVTEADLAITKTGPMTAVAGTSITYDFAVANAGPSDATGATVNDTPPPGLSFVSATGPCAGGFPCALGTVAAGAAPIAFQATFAIDSAVVGNVTNVAEVTSATTDPAAGNNVASAVTDVVAEADLAVTKTGPATAVAGTQATYDITVTNNGPSDAGTVSIADPTPAGYTFVSATAPCAGGFPCALGDIAAGAPPIAFQVTYDIDPSIGGTSVSNTASVSSATTDPTPGNDSSTATTSINAEADLAVTKAGPATATAGTPVTYTLTVTNNGPSDAETVSLDDPTPAGFIFASATAPCTGGFPCALGTMAPSDMIAVDVTFDIAPATTGDVTNTATASSPTTDPNGANDSASVTTTVAADADLSIVKTVDDAAVQLGDTVVYTLAVTNAGPSDATNVVITDNLPQGQVLVSTTGCFEDPSGAPTCSIDTVTAGSTVAVTLTALVQRATGVQTNTASVASDTPDPDGVNNAGSVIVVASFSIPTLGAWGLIALVLMLMAVGGLQVRRMI